MNPRIESVRPLDAYRLAIGFTDGTHSEIDLRDRIVGRGGVFRELEDPSVFSRVRVDPEAGTIVFPHVDFCPDVLYIESHAKHTLR